MKKRRFRCWIHAGALLILSCFAAAPLSAGWMEAVRSAPPAPGLQLRDSRGESHLLAELAGKVVLVNFWATWCEPCLEEMPSILRLQRLIDDERLVVLGVAVEEPAGRVRQWEQRLELDFPTLLDRQGQAQRDWQVRVFPSSYLVDGAGRIRYRALGPVDWDGPEALQAVRGLLSEIEQETTASSR